MKNFGKDINCLKQIVISNIALSCKVTVCTRSFLRKFLDNFHPAGEPEASICKAFKGLQMDASVTCNIRVAPDRNASPREVLTNVRTPVF